MASFRTRAPDGFKRMLDGALSPRASRAPRDERGEQIGPDGENEPPNGTRNGTEARPAAIYVLAGRADLVVALDLGEEHANH